MVKKTVTIRREQGLEARPIAVLVQKASQFSSKVCIEVGAKSINSKSIMGMMSLSVGSGDAVGVVAEGADEEAAASEIELYLQAQ